ncbi:hypothetical protein ABT187_45350 [Streptomyces sp. NPDC001817]|uniref:hypothetical protein n=1 Tax=Streptomyces sp. NPDC001817 TaxID=3154398 RepID=UPI003317E111
MTEAEFFALLDQARAEATALETAYREWADRKLPQIAEQLTATLLPARHRDPVQMGGSRKGQLKGGPRPARQVDF